MDQFVQLPMPAVRSSIRIVFIAVTIFLLFSIVVYHIKKTRSQSNSHKSVGSLSKVKRFPAKYHLIRVNTTQSNIDEEWKDKRFLCPVTDITQRRRLRRLLETWIQLAAEHKLLWWITYGMLLGSIRYVPFLRNLIILFSCT